MRQAPVLSEKDIKRVLQKCTQTAYPQRNRCVFMLGWLSGMRIGEIAALCVGDVLNARGAGPITGEVVFSAPREVLQLWLVEGLRDLMVANPGIDLSILAADQILDPRRQRLDVILRVGPAARNDDMDCLAEIPVQPVLVCHPDVAARIGVEGEGSITSAGLMRFGAFGPAGPMTLRSKAGGKPGREVDCARQTLITDVALAIALARAGAGVVGCLEPSVRGDLARGRLVEAFPGFGFPAVAMRIGVSRGHQTPAALLVATELARSLAGFLAPGE